MPRLAKCLIREVCSGDWPALEQMYSEQESQTLPAGYFEEFRQTIRAADVLYLVSEYDGNLVGGGGISYVESKATASLAFGIVAREYQRRGLGTSVLLARLSLLQPDSAGCVVTLSATKWSAPFFQRIGFKMFDDAADERGQVMAYGDLRLYPAHVQQMRQIIEAAGVELMLAREVPLRH